MPKRTVFFIPGIPKEKGAHDYRLIGDLILKNEKVFNPVLWVP